MAYLGSVALRLDLEKVDFCAKGIKDVNGLSERIDIRYYIFHFGRVP